MPAESLQELFVVELREMYDGEKRLVRAPPKMARAATSRELQTALTNHRKETERQVGRLEQVFRTLSEKPRGKKCDGIMGIVEEGNKATEALDGGPILDAALIAGAQKVEHYEIASYGTLAYFAELLENERAKELLGATLDEEKAADEKLNQIAMSDVNRRALTEGGGEDSEEMGFTPAGMMRRAASAVGLTNDRQRRVRGSGRGTPRRTSKKR
jgi:ferritin-like metal-binding protein YciE